VKALAWHRKGVIRCDEVPEPQDRASARCDHQDHRLRYLRFRPAYLRRRWLTSSRIPVTPQSAFWSCSRPVFVDISLAQWMALTPHELVQAHLNLDGDILKALSMPLRLMPDIPVREQNNTPLVASSPPQLWVTVAVCLSTEPKKRRSGSSSSSAS